MSNSVDDRTEPCFEGKLYHNIFCSNAPENKDNDFTWKDFQAKNNNELVAILGNYINRVFVLCHKYWDGKTPPRNNTKQIDDDVLLKIKNAPDMIVKYKHLLLPYNIENTERTNNTS